MHDLRYDQEENDAATHRRLTAPSPAPNGTPAAAPYARRDPTDLHTVPMPELRSPEARLLDAAQRGVTGEDGEPRDVRTFPEMVVAELVRLVDTMQGFGLRQDVFEEELTARRAVVDARLTRLEDSLKRVADSIQIMALERDGRGRG